jgi:hypothetical protein
MRKLLLLALGSITLLRADITWIGTPTVNAEVSSSQGGVTAVTSGSALDIAASCEEAGASCSVSFDVQQQFLVATAGTYILDTGISGSIQASDCSPFTCTPYYASINSTLNGSASIFPFPNANLTLSGTPVSITGSSYYSCPDPTYCDTFLTVSGSNDDSAFLAPGTYYVDISYQWSVESTGDPQFNAQFGVTVIETTPEPAMPALIVLLVGVAAIKRYLSAQPTHKLADHQHLLKSYLRKYTSRWTKGVRL